MDDRPALYELPTWREPPWHTTAVPVAPTLADLAALPGGVPAALDTERAVQAFAAACSVPLAEADIEADLIFPSWRHAHRDWVRAAYLDFYAWCTEHGWLGGTPTPPPTRKRGRPRKSPEAGRPEPEPEPELVS